MRSKSSIMVRDGRCVSLGGVFPIARWASARGETDDDLDCSSSCYEAEAVNHVVSNAPRTRHTCLPSSSYTVFHHTKTLKVEFMGVKLNHPEIIQHTWWHLYSLLCLVHILDVWRFSDNNNKTSLVFPSIRCCIGKQILSIGDWSVNK